MDKYIQLPESKTIKIGIKNSDGSIKKDKDGKEIYLEFDMEDIELPLKYQKCEFLVRKAQQDLKFDYLIIDKHQDIKGKFLLSKNQEDKIKATQKFYKTMEEAMDMFIGQGGVQKIFGNRRYLRMFDDLGDMLEPILPLLKNNVDNIDKEIKEKYKTTDKETLKDE
jgi:hypothetical protein